MFGRPKLLVSRLHRARREVQSGRVAAVLAIGLCLGSSACQKAQSTTQAPVPVIVDHVIEKDVPIYSTWVGTTVGYINAQIRPQVQGFLLKQTYKDGDFVKTGQLLFQIDDREYKAALDQAIGNLAQQEAVLKKNQNDVERFTPLEAKGAVSKEELDDAVQATRASEAQVQAAKAAVENAKLNLGWTRVNSPIDGIAEIAPVQVGDLVNPSTLLTTVSTIDPIKVTFPISEQEYLQFADKIKEHAQTGRAKDEPSLEMVLADGATYKYPGQFYVTNRQVDLQTGTIQVQGLFPNPEGTLRPGLYAKIRAATQVRRGALLVPQRAVQETQGQYQVAVVGTDDKVSLRMVKPGQQVDNLWIIDDGLQVGEEVVTEGLQKIKEGSVVKAQTAPEAGSPPLPAAPPPPSPRG